MRGIIDCRIPRNFFDPMGWIQIRGPKCVTQATSLDTEPISATASQPETSSTRCGPGNLGIHWPVIVTAKEHMQAFGFNKCELKKNI